MSNRLHAVFALGAVLVAVFGLSGCPMQPKYPSTIVPIYAATSGGGLFVYNGTGWTNYTMATTGGGLASNTVNSVVVSGSGSGAVVVAGTSAGVSAFNGATWAQLNGGLGAPPVNRFFLGSNLYAATGGGFSILNSDGQTWTNTPVGSAVNDVFASGTYTYAAANNGLYIYNGASLVGGAAIPAATIVPGSGSVTAVFVDPLNDIIVGTNNGLAIQYAGTGPWVPLLSGPSVHQITMDSNGNLYAATLNGLYIFSTSNVLALSGTNVLCVFVDGAGRIYAGTATGLVVSTNMGSTWTTELSGQQMNSVFTTAPLYSF